MGKRGLMKYVGLEPSTPGGETQLVGVGPYPGVLRRTDPVRH